MGTQSNKIQKRRRRADYLKRKKEQARFGAKLSTRPAAAAEKPVAKSAPKPVAPKKEKTEAPAKKAPAKKAPAKKPEASAE